MKNLKRLIMTTLAAAALVAAFAGQAFATGADMVPPTTVSDAVASYEGSAMIMLTATDNVGGSGVAKTYYTLDGGPQTEGTEINVSTLGMHDITFWSVDNAAMVESPAKTAMFVIAAAGSTDMVGPMTAAGVLPTYWGSATIKFTATDEMGGSGVAHTHYELDGGAEVMGPDLTLTVTTPGAHMLKYWSVDNAGNVENPVMTSNFTVNALQPTVVTVKPSSSKSARGKTVTFRGTLDLAQAGDVITVYVKKPGKRTWAAKTITLTSSAWSYKYKFSKSGSGRGTYYVYVKFAGDPTRLGSVSKPVRVKVR